MTRFDLQAAAEMTNEGIDPDALLYALTECHILRFVHDGVEYMLDDGPCVVRWTPNGKVVE